MTWFQWSRQLASPRTTTWPLFINSLLLLASWVTRSAGMTDEDISALRQDTRDLFYHGYSNYMTHAFPEDELRPISCRPQTRNRDNPADIGTNDVLGNYSLTLIDSLSTLAILAGGEGDGEDGHDALQDFQSGVKALVGLYGDGKEGSCGTRACAFELDSKVQVFETNIRGVGGLLSAHLFAIGALPIRGYECKWQDMKDGTRGIRWDNNFVYDGQLLRLAHDLATRLLPAFSTSTDLPYPRVNLRHGIPFYQAMDQGFCRLDGTSSTSDQVREITETCAAGAGSLVLEFTTLSRLTGDMRFEQLAKKAFWAIWNRRSNLGLVGGGIDAESGQWTIPPLAGIGAGIDSFFEYAFKSYILLSNLGGTPAHHYDDPASFFDVWQQSHAAIHHHIRRSSGMTHPFYGQSDPFSGGPRYSWIDNLSAYYPSLLVLAGELDEAIESHLLFSALWTRYSALPERWHTPASTFGTSNAPGGWIDSNFKHWAGRPEFIESTYYLYQATKDPWYLHVGEMTLRDIRRRCWAKCGWADLGDVVSGEQRDRMESFFLGETAKYLYLLFEPSHPLNRLRNDGVVFTTEGHPLVIPKTAYRPANEEKTDESRPSMVPAPAPICPVPPPPLPLTISNIANRHDLFHAAALAQLHLVPVNPARSSPLLEASNAGPGISLADIRSPTNYTFYPWTLPRSLIPAKGMSSKVLMPVISTLTFPDLSPAKDSTDGTSPKSGSGIVPPFGALQKIIDGVLVHSLSNLRLSMVQEPRSLFLPAEEEGSVAVEVGREFRVQGVANWALGRDEKVLVSGRAMEGVSPSDPHFTRVKDLEWVDLVLDVPVPPTSTAIGGEEEGTWPGEGGTEVLFDMPKGSGNSSKLESLWEEVENMVGSLLSDKGIEITTPDEEKSHHIHQATQSIMTGTTTIVDASATPSLKRHLIPAILPTGAGAAPLPPILDTTTDPITLTPGTLSLRKIFFLDSTLCTHKLPPAIAKTYTALIIRRGECSFGEKLANIPPSSPDSGIQLVIILDDDDAAVGGSLIRPLLDTPQKTPSGLERRHPIAMCMVAGLRETEIGLRRLASAVGGFDEKGRVFELENEFAGGGLGVKRRFWFESLGVPIVNLIML